MRIDEIRRRVEKLPADLPLRRQLLAFLARAGDDVEAFERAVEQWYDEQMAKIAGWYKRWSRVILGVVGFLVAVAVNIDTVQVGALALRRRPAAAGGGGHGERRHAVPGHHCSGRRGPSARRTELDTLRVAGLPVGYSAELPLAHRASGERAGPGRMERRRTAGTPWRKLLGWLVTAFAVSFGAPFWFEALSRLGSLRNAGTKPSSTASG